MRSALTAITLGVALLVGACQDSSSIAYGDANSIIIAAPDTVWEAVGEDILEAFEVPVFTSRNERAFEITHVDPDSPEWSQLRFWRQVVVLGLRDDPWVAPVVDARRSEIVSSDPEIVEGESIWARGQRVTAVVLPEADALPVIREALPLLFDRFEGRYYDHVIERMYASGANVELKDSLVEAAGFGLTPPNVYRTWTEAGPDGEPVYAFVNDQSAGNQLIRAVLVSWREGTEPVTVEEALRWRDELMVPTYDLPHLSQPEPLQTATLSERSAGSIEVRGIWDGTDDDGFPIAGPFMTRIVVCPEQGRTYLMDAWLYAPSRSKREYMLQLETILDTFECGA